ncbi:hypothetical protein NPIL_111571 [Nephila pilipes]|uniref:Uncharacterized protein n=1 Tax=Nephila pilipes TaxID=299642 RepID=A0A8X6IAQ9_NEPPI|nr:hypothetical protein NPIL_111571 [Nephila pilipes]
MQNQSEEDYVKIGVKVPQIVTIENYEVKQTMRLPELSLKEFDGNPREWLSSWNIFVKMHEDPKLDDLMKFLYLMQSTVPKLKARDIVERFSTTADYYSKAAEHLKNIRS